MTESAAQIRSEWLCRPDVCRCCLAGGGTWDLTGAYISEGCGNEVLLHMLKDCLGIALSNVSEWGPSRFICDGCAACLRQAHSFKKQVLHSEDTFMAYLGGNGDINLDLSVVKTEENVEKMTQDDANFNLQDMKIEEEITEQESGIEQQHPESLTEISSKLSSLNVKTPIKKKKSTKAAKNICSNDKYVKKFRPAEKYMSEIDPTDKYMKQIGPTDKHMKQIGPTDKNMKQIGPTDKYTKEYNATDKSMNNMTYYDDAYDNDSEDDNSDTPISQLSKENLDFESKNDFTLVKELKSDKNDYCQTANILYKALKRSKLPMKQVSERKRIRLTCETVLKHTTACPFRHHKSWFQCFYCSIDFMEISVLRQHTLQNHNSEDVASMKRYPRSLQIDITEFRCNICSLNLEDVKNMVKHFSEVHEKVVYKECIADYKLNTSPFTCHICLKQYHVFRTLTTHLNEHYANCICDICGKSFLNSKRLKVHKRTHESGNFPCAECGKVLKTKTSKSNHMESHSKRIIKCHICLKPMKHYNDRVKHMSEEHNITNLFKCVVCGREYKIKHYLATHMRQTHGHKNKKCLECGMAFITNYGLKKHMLKHTGEKAFVCTICNKSYARSYTLREHMRGHEGEAKFVGA